MNVRTAIEQLEVCVRRGRWLAAVCAVAALTLAACTPDGQVPPSKRSASPSASASGPTRLSFVVYGAPTVIAAYRKIAADFTVDHPDIRVEVDGFANHAEAMGALHAQLSGGHPPNLFLIERRDLDTLRDEDAVRHVDDLLSARQVDFGDGYARDPLESFSADNALQCMPTQVSPLVVYYNPRLVNLSMLPDPGARPVDQARGWGMQQFIKAARLASHGKKRGVYIAPSLEEIAPFIWSAGGNVADSTADPTTLTLVGGKGAKALGQLLELVRDPQVTFSKQQIAKKDAVQRFIDGQLGMILGYRELTPVLRKHKNLAFDVMPMPKLGAKATIGRSSAVCVGKGSANLSETADFLAYLVGDHAMRVLADTGYVMPTNLEVTTSTDFIQPTLQPAHGGVFSDQARQIRTLPYGPRWAVAEAQADRALVRLWYDPVIDNLDDRLTAIDDASARILQPPSPSPTPTPSGSTGSPSPTS